MRCGSLVSFHHHGRLGGDDVVRTGTKKITSLTSGTHGTRIGNSKYAITRDATQFRGTNIHSAERSTGTALVRVLYEYSVLL